MIDTSLRLWSKYLTKHRSVIHLVVVVLGGCCGGGVAGGVHSRVETEQRRRPSTETVRFLEHSQRQLLQTKSTERLNVFIWLIVFAFLSKFIFSTQGWCVSSLQKQILCSSFFNVHYFCPFSSSRRSECSMSTHKDTHCSKNLRIVNA